MVYKPFDPVLYKQNNSPGTSTSLSLLHQFGYETVEGEEVNRYSKWDCLVKGNSGVAIAIECEKKNVWRRHDDWEGYSTTRVPARKESEADLYMMVNQHCSAVLVCEMPKVKESPIEMVHTRISDTEEPFFMVPIEHFDLYILEDGIWKPKTIRNNLLDLYHDCIECDSLN